jgi:hypothetical protein
MKNIFFTLLTVIAVSAIPLQADAFAGGDGSAGDLYQISTCTELESAGIVDLDANYILINDIDCTDTIEEGFNPIGDSSTPFTGTFDGQGFKITQLNIDLDVAFIGLFGQTSATAEISNVGLENVNFTDGASGTSLARAGGLVALNNGSITNSYSTGDIVVHLTGQAGGLVGLNSGAGGVISNSYSLANVTNPGGLAGGLSGGNTGTITNSYSVGVVSGRVSPPGGGGLTASNTGTVTDSFWDTETSGQATSAGGTGKTTAEMKDVATFTDTDTAGLTTSWDFLGNSNDDEAGDDDWSIDAGENDGYPFLTAFVDTVPGIPTSLSASAVSSTQIGLSWSAPAYDGNGTITGYQIERKVAAGFFATLVADTGDTDTTYEDTGLTAETLYAYRVSAINAIGTSSASTEASATTPKTPTGSAINLSGSSNDDDSDDEDESDEEEEEPASDEADDTLTDEQRENIQRQINEMRELIVELIRLIEILFGIQVNLDF